MASCDVLLGDTLSRGERAREEDGDERYSSASCLSRLMGGSMSALSGSGCGMRGRQESE